MSLLELLLSLKMIEFDKRNGINLDTTIANEKLLTDAVIKIYAVSNDIGIEKSNNKKAYQWLLEQEGVNLLNWLLNETLEEWVGNIEDSNKQDVFMYYNISSLNTLMRSITKDMIIKTFKKTPDLSIKTSSEEEIAFSKLSNDEIERIIVVILSEIDPSLRWTKMFYQAKKEGRFIDLQPGDEEKRKAIMQKLEIGLLDYGWSYIPISKGFIITQTNNTIHDIINYIHEFGHRLCGEQTTVLSEYFSTTMELYAISYLERIGYNKTEIDRLYSIRTNNTISAFYHGQTLLEMLENYKEGKPVEIDSIISDATDWIKKGKEVLSEQTKQQISQTMPDFFDPFSQAYEMINEKIDNLINSHEGLCLEYPYIIGHYLGDLTIQKIKKSPEFSATFVQWVEMSMVNPYEVFEKLGCDMSPFVNPDEILSEKTPVNVKRKSP